MSRRNSSDAEARKLSGLPLADAIESRWRDTHGARGDDGGGDPLGEMFVNLLDSLGLVAVCMGRGEEIPAMAATYRELRKAARRVRRLVRERGGEEVSRG